MTHGKNGRQNYLTTIVLLLGFILMAGMYGCGGGSHDSAPAAAPSSGSLDTTFGAAGIVTRPIGSSHDYAQGLAIQPDGKIVLAGHSQAGSNNFTLARFNADGSLDGTFNPDWGGMVTTAVGVGGSLAFKVVIQDDGKIVAAGQAHNGTNDDFALVRYNTDGSLDTTFGTEGMVLTNITTNDYIRALAIQPDGKIVAGGVAWNTALAEYQFALVRYNTDGSLDTTFGTAGIVITPEGSGTAAGIQAIVIRDGRILVGGQASNGSNYDFALVRYNTDGSLDTTFGTGGMVMTPVGGADDAVCALGIQGDGKIVAGGYSWGGAANHYDFALVRYNIDGSLDTTFGTDGAVKTHFGTGEDIGIAVAIQSDGKIVLAGHAKVGSGDSFALVRYNIDGSLDTTFGTDGKTTTSVGSGDEWATGVAIQDDGKIVAGGIAWNGSDYDFAVVRYWP